uniref:Uncharacterized protein n=1 Tax=Haptolina brevifila TaxID=156173 RepID=A0A7S2CLJ9_9EUKA
MGSSFSNSLTFGPSQGGPLDANQTRTAIANFMAMSAKKQTVTNELGRHKIPIDQLVDVQGWGTTGRIESSGFSRVHTHRGQLDHTYLAHRQAAKCYFAFYGSGPSMGLFSSNGELIETVHRKCDLRNLHQDALFYVGDDHWGTIVLTSGLKHERYLRLDGCTPCPGALQLRTWLQSKFGASWELVRQHVKLRGIFFYWLDLTQHLMADGGARQQTDLLAFEQDIGALAD